MREKQRLNKEHLVAMAAYRRRLRGGNREKIRVAARKIIEIMDHSREIAEIG